MQQFVLVRSTPIIDYETVICVEPLLSGKSGVTGSEIGKVRFAHMLHSPSRDIRGKGVKQTPLIFTPYNFGREEVFNCKAEQPLCLSLMNPVGCTYGIEHLHVELDFSPIDENRQRATIAHVRIRFTRITWNAPFTRTGIEIAYCPAR